jgi:hypothetical protein
MRAKFIYEAMEDILRPKSEEEIIFGIINLINHSPDLMNAFSFIMSGITSELKSEIEKLCELMNSNPEDVYFLTENDDDYNYVDKILYKIYDSVFIENKPPETEFMGKNVQYTINPISKIAHGNDYDLNGVNTIFFNRPHVLKILRNTKSWEF